MMASSDDERNNSYQTLIPSTRVECQSTFVQHFDEMNNNAHHNHSENQTIRFNSSLPTYGGLVVSNSVEIGSSTHKKSLINRILIILVAVVGLASVFIHLSNTPTHPLPVSKAPLTTKEQTKDPIVRMRSPAPGSPCIPGLFHDPTTQLPPTHLWQLPGRNIKVLQTSISLPPLTLQRAHLLTYPQTPSTSPFLLECYDVHKVPMYANHNLNEPGHYRVKYALIVQHGNNRNANDYYCAAVNSLIETGWSDAKMRSVLIIAPYFPIIGDLCWDHNNASVPAHNISDPVLTNCGYQIWSNEGWKDGHISLGPTPNIFSYDVLNSLINYVGDGTNFPLLKNITLFGFSAGAQTILRFAALTNYNILNKNITQPRYVISDPSTYLYFTPERPYHRHVNGTNKESANNTVNGSNLVEAADEAQITFQVPNATWITNWRTRADGTDWIKGWSTECRTNGSKQPCCDEYNDWRFGFNNMNGYYRSQFNLDLNAANNLIANFQNLDITYLVGTDDNVNCDLSNPVGCNDNDLATYCPAMLQGDNRLDRALNWQAYLLHLYKHPIHRLFNAQGVAHDPVQMLRSPSSRCAIFNVCDVDSPEDPAGNGGAGNDPNDMDPPCGEGGACGDTPYPDPTPAPTQIPTWEPTQYPTTIWKGRSDKSYLLFVGMVAGWIGIMLCLVCVRRYGFCEWYSTD